MGTSAPPTEKGPRRFGPYLIFDRIGDGGMAEIFVAKRQGYSGFEKMVALKKILPRYSENPSFASMLIHEAKLAAKLTHFNVVQVLDLGEHERMVYIAMEYIRGKDLAALLSNTYRRKEKLPVELSLFIATEFLTGLDYAHRLQNEDGRPLGLIHRDISPQNILISYEGEVKVTDFGIARVISAQDGFQLPGNLHGKFGYMSPEQVVGKPLDQRSDIFSAGVVLHEMLTGQRLFRGKSPQATVEMILRNKLAPPSEINGRIPPEVDRICTKALARNREERYQTVGAFLGELSRTADKLQQRAARRDLAVYMRRQFGALVNRRSQRSSRAPVSSKSAVSAFSPTAGTRQPLGEILVEQGSVSLSELEIGLAEQRARGGRIGEVLLESGAISESDLVRSLSKQSNLPAAGTDDLVGREPDPQLLLRFPKEIAQATHIVPLGTSPDGALVELLVEDPFDQRSILEARVVLGVNSVNVQLAPKSIIQDMIARWYPRDEVEPALVPAPEPAEMVDRPVLIADSDEALANELAEKVRDEEYEVIVAHDGKHARELARSRDPAVVFLDAFLPKIDGYNVLLDMRSRDSDAAVFVTSSRADDFHQAKALELGADDFLVKPLSLQVTTSKIRREMQKRQGKRALTNNSSTSGGVSGSLTDMTLIDIVQSLELGRKSAHIMIQYEDGRTGEVGVLEGNTIACLAGSHVSEDAFYVLAKQGPGLFRIEYKAPGIERNIDSPNTFLILETLRRLDEEGLEVEIDMDLSSDLNFPPPQTVPPPTPDLRGASPQAHHTTPAPQAAPRAATPLDARHLRPTHPHPGAAPKAQRSPSQARRPPSRAPRPPSQARPAGPTQPAAAPVSRPPVRRGPTPTQPTAGRPTPTEPTARAPAPNPGPMITAPVAPQPASIRQGVQGTPAPTPSQPIDLNTDDLVLDLPTAAPSWSGPPPQNLPPLQAPHSPRPPSEPPQEWGQEQSDGFMRNTVFPDSPQHQEDDPGTPIPRGFVQAPSASRGNSRRPTRAPEAPEPAPLPPDEPVTQLARLALKRVTTESETAQPPPGIDEPNK